MKKISLISLIIVLGVIIIDQILKFYIKTHFKLEETLPYLGNWAKLYFIENPGFALGLKLGGDSSAGEYWGKVFLTIFRTIASGLLIFYISQLIKKSTKKGVIIGLAFITAGAIGNLVDCIFYGVLFSPASTEQVSQFLPAVLNWSEALHGKVVDMFYFPIIESNYPTWFPFVGGQRFVFFRFVFNVADAAISCGVFYMIIFERHFFMQKKE